MWWRPAAKPAFSCCCGFLFGSQNGTQQHCYQAGLYFTSSSVVRFLPLQRLHRRRKRAISDAVTDELVAAFASQVNGLEVSKNDDRAYKYMELTNGLKVVVCSDPAADFAAASMEVSTSAHSSPLRPQSQRIPNNYRRVLHNLASLRENCRFDACRYRLDISQTQRKYQELLTSASTCCSSGQSRFVFAMKAVACTPTRQV